MQNERADLPFAGNHSTHHSCGNRTFEHAIRFCLRTRTRSPFALHISTIAVRAILSNRTSMTQEFPMVGCFQSAGTRCACRWAHHRIMHGRQAPSWSGLHLILVEIFRAACPTPVGEDNPVPCSVQGTCRHNQNRSAWSKSVSKPPRLRH
jgi:hypothetical protein